MGTHDVSILEFGSGVFEVLSTAGDTHLGGDDIDNKIIKYLVDMFKSDECVDLSKDTMAMQRLKEAAEKAKIELSSSTSTEINLPYITSVDGMPKHLVTTLTRAKFEQLIDDIVRATIEPCKVAIDKAGVSVSEIDEVLLVGGSTRIPAIQQAVKNFFGKEPSKGVNPDEAVAEGAAIQGAILNKEDGVGDVVLLDVLPITLGIEAHNQFDPQARIAKIIEGNTTIPCKKSQIFTTAVDNQEAVDIVVLQGERTYAKDCKRIGTFRLDGIAPAKAGVPQIEVTFDVDANSVLKVTAKDIATGKEQNITIQNSSLSEEEIAKMKADAEAHKAEDEKREEEMNKLNMAQAYCNSIGKVLEDETMSAKMSEDEKKNIKEAKDNLDNALNEFGKSKDNTEVLKSVEEAQKKLEEVYGLVISRIYAEQNPQTGDSQQANPFGNGFNFADMNNPFNK